MSDAQTSGDPAAVRPAAGADGCCGNPTQATEVATAPCCGTATDAVAESSCCASTAKADAVAAGQACCA